MSVKKSPTRREFLKTTGAAIAAPYVITSTALSKRHVKSIAR
jgi:hypothetical protein